MRKEIISDGVEIYLGDCREILPTLGEVGAIVTDPPYPNWLADQLCAHEFSPEMLEYHECKQFIFWTARVKFPLSFSAQHIWHKTGSGDIAAYEMIYERNGGATFKVFTGNPISNPTMARFAKDKWHDHPTQKPVSLMIQLVAETDGRVVDPFMGSGTTGEAALKLGRDFVGVEINPRYFDVAIRRIQSAAKQQDLFHSKAKQEAFEL